MVGGAWNVGGVILTVEKRSSRREIGPTVNLLQPTGYVMHKEV
jgi:hypothetical protein